MSNALINKTIEEAWADLNTAFAYLAEARAKLKSINHVEVEACEQLLAKAKILRLKLNPSQSRPGRAS